MITLLQYGSAAFAFLAAVFWFWSARASLPDAIRHVDYGGFSTREKAVDDLDRLTSGLLRQSRWSARAALTAAVAAVLQGLALVVS